MRKWIFSILCLSLIAGCQQGVTDIGNPTTNAKPPQNSPDGPSSPMSAQPAPTVSQLLGTYRVTTGDCMSTANAVPTITVAEKSTQIILSNFLSYSPAMQLTTVEYSVGFFTLADTNAGVSCTGRAQFTNTTPQITLQCEIATSSANSCTNTYLKD